MSRSTCMQAALDELRLAGASNVTVAKGSRHPLDQSGGRVAILRGARNAVRPPPFFSEPENAGARPSAPSAPMSKPNSANGLAAPDLRTMEDDSADHADDSGGQTVRANSLKSNAKTDADGADANPPPQSTPEKTGASGWSTRL